MYSRRKFLNKTTFASLATFLGLSQRMSCQEEPYSVLQPSKSYPIVISTWNHGLEANESAWTILNAKGTALDAVEKGVRATEADPEVSSVGYGGLPDRDGNVTLDACIMDSEGKCGAVCFLKNIKHPISVARKVMEDTPHVMLAGLGAQEFALAKGFQEENLLTDKARAAWEEWKDAAKYQPKINQENHDTIGMLAIDVKGNIAGACTTSGLAYKMHGRVGDSPIIGAGLFIDNEVGGAVATGMGEEIIKTVGSFLIVELMRQGFSPQKACETAIERITKSKDTKELQIGYLALNKRGEIGSMSIHKGFNYAVYQNKENKLVDAPCWST